jgi:hypothetical protein
MGRPGHHVDFNAALFGADQEVVPPVVETQEEK